MCSAGNALYSKSADSPGTLSPTGLYTAPATIDTRQTVNVTATTLGANSSPLSATITLMPPVGVTVLPGQTLLPAGGTQQFTANVTNTTNGGVTWSLDAGSVGSVSPSGIYTAPSTASAQQTANVIATSLADPTQSASATVTIGVPGPAVSVRISPTSITLNENQTQQFTATVNNSLGQMVTWTMSPAGLGSLDQTGTYIAPSSITTQQTVIVTATSQSDPTQSASAMITLAPGTCASTGYGNQRVIVIDHTKVANTDQVNFPFLFNSTDPDLANVGSGGHVISSNGNDIIFSSDPNGRTRLDFEVEQYDPATGQLVAWIRIPELSHATDTIIYVFYGNPAITVSQANPSGVWDSHYEAVYHLGNLPSTAVASDSTNYANNASFTNLTAMPGLMDGSALLDGVTSYLEIPATAFPNYPTGVYSNLGVDTNWDNTGFDATFGIWFKTASWGGLLDQTSGYSCGSWICIFPSSEQPGMDPAGSWGSMLDIDFNGNLEGRGVGASTQSYNDNNWHYATITFENNVNSLYADGKLVATGSGSTFGFSPNYAYFVGTEDIESDTSSVDSRPWIYLNGMIDEINVSNTARSGDWIQTQYNNQSSPSTFYTFYSPTTTQVAPSSISLYASQSEQFAVPSSCDATIVWTLPSGALGTLTSSGLYTAPSAVSSQQTVIVSATSQSNGSSLGSAQVTLLTPPQPLTLIAASPSPYQAGTTQTFTATVLDTQGNPRIGVQVNFVIAGVNATVGSAATSTNGTASFSYTGSNTGTDTLQVTASVDGALLSSNALTAAWLTPPPISVPTVTLLPQPSPGRGALMGAFTDNNGNLIEPIVVGTPARTFITPGGATRLQLGIDDNYYQDNAGAGFVVAVNGVNVTVPPTSQPWNWQTGGLNNNYQYGINDGSDPVVGAANLTAGQPVSIAYQSGTVTTNTLIRPLVSANGETDFTTGTKVWQGAYFPTLYTTGIAYPQSQPINVFAVVTDATGTPIRNVPVTLSVAGANSGAYHAVSDATGAASFLYTGQYAGNDNLQAQAALTGWETLNSNQGTINWTNYPTPPPVGSLSFNYILSIVNSQSFSSFAKDASGNRLENVDVGFYVTGVDSFQRDSNTDDMGQATFSYYHTRSGNYSIIAVDSANRNVIVTPAYTGYWQVPSGTPVASGGSISIGITASQYNTLGTPLQLNGTITDSAGLATTAAWAEVSGPGTVTFADPSNPATTATFSQIGTYVLQLSATDSANSGWAQISVTVVAPSVASVSQGWIGSPSYGSPVSGLVPITLAPGVVLQSGTLIYYPGSNPSNVTILNGNTTGSGQIGTLDTTRLPNGSYWIELQGTDASGSAQYSLIQVTVIGNYKPGRVTTTVTDLIVPATGLPISIQRTYDSLNAGLNGDFGYGWNLGISVNLTVDNSGDVTFTLGGQRKTFYFSAQPPPTSVYFVFISQGTFSTFTTVSTLQEADEIKQVLTKEGFQVTISTGFGVGLFPWVNLPTYTPEPGLRGTLVSSGSGCPGGFDFLWPDGQCDGGGFYAPQGYIYTDPNGTSYTISASGALQSIQDRSGNGITITAKGITSTTGLNVPFVRDAQNRITQITDPQGNVYLYGYDDNGNLSTVTYPNTAQASTYTYDTNHLYLTGTDARTNPLPVTAYYTSTDTDPNGLPLSGRLQSVTNAAGETSYAYNLVTNTTSVTYPDKGTATMVYDSYGNLLSSTDPLGNTTTNVYDTNHNLISVKDPLGNTTAYSYDSNGNKTSSTYPKTATSNNTTSTTGYNQYSEPTSTTDELGNARTFNYDANYNPQSVTDASGTLASFLFNANSTLAAGAIGFDISASPGMASQFTYDASGDMASRTDALGRTTTYTYDSLGHKTATVTPTPTTLAGGPASTTTYQYDALGNLIQTAAPLGRTTGSTYDANGNKLSDTDARGNVTTYQYDALNRLTTTTYPDKTTSSKTYDFRNSVLTSTDQAGNITQNAYDLAGRLTSVTRGYGTSTASTTSYAYDNAGRKISETDALAHTTSYTYDAAGRLTAVSGVKGNTAYGYDDAGNQTSRTDGNGNTTSFQYDARKRLIKTTYPDKTTVVNTYDGPGNLASVTDQNGNVVEYTYDAANQLKTVVQVNHPDPSKNTNLYGYDNLGNLTGLTDENLHSTVNGFDVFNESVSKLLPDATHTESRQYDTAGNLLSLTHFNGITTTYTYDALNRLLSRTTPGEAPVSFTYTATGKYLTSTAADGTVKYTYDALDRLATKATPEGTLSYTYDAAGHVESIVSSNPNGASVAYTYDELNRLGAVVDNRLPGQNTTTYTYDPASNVATVAYANGLQSNFTYDTLNRLTEMITPVSGYSYTLGATGNRTQAVEINGRTLNWNYDGINRLTSETISDDPSKSNGSVSYGLDPVGNRLSASSTLSGVSSGTFTYNADDQISSETYDANGNTLTAGGKIYTYDAENHMTSMTSGSTAVTMAYDAFGNRVAKTVNGVTTKYLVEDDVNPTGLPQVLEETVNGAVQRVYTYGLQRISQYQMVSGTWTASYYGYDGAGSVRQLTNSAGAVTDSYEYDAFGNSFTKTGSTPNNYLYRGEQYDSDLGLYYLRARYYNPVTGRFVSRDPEDGIATDPATLHKYLYAGGDPVNKKDPTGRDFVEVALIDVNLAVRQAAALTAVAAGVVCILNEAAQLLQGLATDITAPIESITFGFCSAKVKRGCACTAKCTCHVIGMPNHMNTGIYVFGAATASSCPAAQTLAKVDAGESCGAGAHAQHCSYQCDGR